MSQEGGRGGHEGFLWEGQAWAFSDSDRSGESDNHKGKKPMESGSHSPPGPMASIGKKRGPDGAPKGSASKGGGSGSKDGVESDHEAHIWTERERRKKMRNMFASLHALLPNSPPKADKSTIVNEAVKQIKTLQQTLQKLQKQKLDRLRGLTSVEEPPSVMALQTPGGEEAATREAFMADMGKIWGAASSPTTVSIPRFPSCFQTWTTPNVVLNVTGEDAHISICTAKKPGTLTAISFVLEKHKLDVVSAHVSSDYFRSMFMIHARARGVSDQFPEILMIEELFKLAVNEIILWLSSP